MASTVTRSQSNRAPLGCGGTGDSHHGCAADKSAATVWCYHVNMDQNLWGIFPTPCWIYATKIEGSSEGKRGSNLVWQGVHNKVASECISSYIWKRLLSFVLYKNVSMITPWTVKTCERQVSFSLTVSNSLRDNALVLLKGHRALLNGHWMYLLQKTLWNICESICNIFSHQYLLSSFSPPLK